MSQPERYLKVIQWLLENINPEISEMKQTIYRVCATIDPKISPLSFTLPTTLTEVLLHVEEVEATTNLVCLKYVSSFKPRDIPNDILNIPNEKFELQFARLLPRIDSSLTSIEETIKLLNDNVTHVNLEIEEAVVGQQTALQKQVRFIDKAKRVKRNLKHIEDKLKVISSSPSSSSSSSSSSTNSVPLPPDIQLLYTPPEWSSTPNTPYYFEVVDSGIVIDKIKLNIRGHLLIGRLPLCDIIVDDATCSRQHAILQFRLGDPNEITGIRVDELYVYDLGSTSGTYVNQVHLTPQSYYPLISGDLIQFGQFPSSFILRQGDFITPKIEPPKPLPSSSSSSPSPSPTTNNNILSSTIDGSGSNVHYSSKATNPSSSSSLQHMNTSSSPPSGVHSGLRSEQHVSRTSNSSSSSQQRYHDVSGNNSSSFVSGGSGSGIVGGGSGSGGINIHSSSSSPPSVIMSGYNNNNGGGGGDNNSGLDMSILQFDNEISNTNINNNSISSNSNYQHLKNAPVTSASLGSLAKNAIKPIDSQIRVSSGNPISGNPSLQLNFAGLSSISSGSSSSIPNTDRPMSRMNQSSSSSSTSSSQLPINNNPQLTLSGGGGGGSSNIIGGSSLTKSSERRPYNPIPVSHSMANYSEYSKQQQQPPSSSFNNNSNLKGKVSFDEIFGDEDNKNKGGGGAINFSNILNNDHNPGFGDNKQQGNDNNNAMIQPPKPMTASSDVVVSVQNSSKEVKRTNSFTLDPKSKDFDQEAYKRKMLEDYERQQRENAEILRKKKEREMLGLPPIVEIPHVPDRPRRSTVAVGSPATTPRGGKKEKKKEKEKTSKDKDKGEKKKKFRLFNKK